MRRMLIFLAVVVVITNLTGIAISQNRAGLAGDRIVIERADAVNNFNLGNRDGLAEWLDLALHLSSTQNPVVFGNPGQGSYSAEGALFEDGLDAALTIEGATNDQNFGVAYPAGLTGDITSPILQLQQASRDMGKQSLELYLVLDEIGIVEVSCSSTGGEVIQKVRDDWWSRDHLIQIPGISDNSAYRCTATVTDRDGNRGNSDPILVN